jgi:hypothetical protein
MGTSIAISRDAAGGIFKNRRATGKKKASPKQARYKQIGRLRRNTCFI